MNFSDLATEQKLAFIKEKVDKESTFREDWFCGVPVVIRQAPALSDEEIEFLCESGFNLGPA